jgi:ribosomal protein S18 acetylase RimI-like enzyme
MSLTYRTAVPNDIAACIELRGKTRENSVSVERLQALGVTLESWSGDVAAGRMNGYLCLDDAKLVGYCFGDLPTGEVVVLALLPEWEGKSIGKQLLEMVVQDFVKLGLQRIFLGCSSNPKVRSYGFYRHLGWTSTGIFYKNNDEELEYFPSVVKKQVMQD